MSSSEFSQPTYDQLRPLLDESWRRMRRDGRDSSHFLAWTRLRLGPPVRPYVRQFLLDLLEEQRDDHPDEQLDKRGQPTAEQRQAMIAETAYLLAEQAGFGGDSDQHWRQAEHLVAERIANGQAPDGGRDNDRD